MLASLLALALMTVTGFPTPVTAATLQQPYAPTGATGTGNNAPPKGSVPLGNLWDAQNYAIPYHVASCPQPPQNVQARLALANSPVLLKFYGLPTLSQVGDHAEWQKIITHAQTRGCDYTIPYRDGKPIVNGNTPSTWWGGYGALECSGCYNFDGMQGEYTVQSIVICVNRCDDSIWAGVGGANNDQLVQTGVDQSTTWGSISYYNAFYEAVPGNGEHVWGGVSSGDSMWSAAYVNGDVYTSDFTKNHYYSTNVGVSSSLESAEFIVERNGMTQCGNPLWGCTPLANYGAYSIYNVRYQLTTTNWYNVDDYHENFWSWTLQNSSRQTLETNNYFTDYSGGSSWDEVWRQGS